MRHVLFAAFAVVSASGPALAAGNPSIPVRITEFLQSSASGVDREFFELTNLGTSAIDVSGWSYNDDSTKDPVNFSSLAGLGSIAAGETIIFTETSVSDFASYWALPASVRVFSYGKVSNLSGSGDQINIYASATQTAATLVDGIAFGAGTAGVSRNRPFGGTGNVDGSAYLLSAAGDGFGSRFAGGLPTGDLGNPGAYAAAAVAAVPEPAGWATMIAGFGLSGLALRRRRRVALTA